MQYIRNLMNDHHGNFIRFALVGVTNTAIDLGLFAILYYIFMVDAVLAHIFSFCAATLNSFVLNKYWTFGNQHTKAIPRQFVKFIIVTGSALILSTIILWIADQYMWTIAAKLMTIGVTMIWNYTGMRFIVFKDKDADTPAIKDPPA